MQFLISEEDSTKSGIYQIRNTKNGKVYVGSAVNLRKRFLKHKSYLSRNVHPNARLQSAANKYGLESFSFELLEICNRAEVIDREQVWLDKLMVVENGYNISPNADPFSGGIGDIAVAKMKKALTGRKLSEEQKGKMSLAAKSRTRGPRPEWVKEKIRNTQLENVRRLKAESER